MNTGETQADQRNRALRRRDHQILVLRTHLRHQGSVIEEYRAKLHHATERAEADERLLGEQATLIVKVSRDLKDAIEQLKTIITEAAGDLAGE